MVNQFTGYGGLPQYNNFGTYNSNLMTTPKPVYDPALPSGDCLPRVNGMDSAIHYRMNPNSRSVLFDANEDIFYIVTSDASGTNSVEAFSFAPFKTADKNESKYVTKEEFENFKQEVLNGQQSIRIES